MMKINVGDYVETIPTNRRGIVSGVYDKYISIDFLDGSYGDYMLKNIERHIKVLNKADTTNTVVQIDFKNVRKSKVLLKELNELLAILESGISTLQPYRKYVTIPEILMSLKDSKVFLEAHVRKHKLLLEKSGLKEDTE